MAETASYEYRVLTVGRWTGVKDDEIESLLNQLGGEGWEAVSAFCRTSGNKVTLVAKRPISAAERRRRSMPGEGMS